MIGLRETSAKTWGGVCLLWLAVIVGHRHLPAGLLALLAGTGRAGPIGAYALLGILGVGALARLLPDWPRPLLGSLTLILGAFLAGLDEFQQFAIPDQRATLEDWLTAVLGLALAVILARMARGRPALAWLGPFSPEGDGTARPD